MLIVMKKAATPAEIDNVCKVVQSLNLESHPMPGAQRTAICITGNKGSVTKDNFSNLPGVKDVIRVSKPYKLVSRETKIEDTTFKVGDVTIGKDFAVIAGPCSVEEESITLRIAEKLKAHGINLFRAGAFKPRTGPYSFQGLGEQGLEILAKVKQQLGLSIVTEVIDIEKIEMVAEVADVLQVGTRNMANTSLLKKLSKINKPVLLKRGMSATLDEYLQAAEYIMLGGNYQVILCERGIRTFNDHCRNTLDIAAIPTLQERTHLPIFADPSHAAGRTDLVAPLSLACVAAGAQGLLLEAHDDAANAYSDGQQAFHPDNLYNLQQKIINVREGLCLTT